MRLKYLRIAGLTIGGIIIGGIALLHTPPAKQMALGRLQSVLAAQGIRFRASSLDFNLLNLSASLRGVVIQPEGSLPPLAKIEIVDLQLSLRDLILGHFVVTNAVLQKPEIWLVIDANGLTNLPKSKGSQGEAFDYLVQSAALNEGSIVVDDRRDGLKVVLPQWDVRVEGSRLTKRHRMEFTTGKDGLADYGDRVYAVQSLQATLDVGKKDAKLERVALRTTGLSLDGSLHVLDFEKLGLDGKFRISGEVDRFLADAGGRVNADVLIRGTAVSPEVSARLIALDGSWQKYRNIELAGDFTYDGQRKLVLGKGLTVKSPLGNLSGDGQVALGGGTSTFAGTFERLRLNGFVTGLASTASGNVRAQWEALNFTTATGDANIRLVGNRPAAEGVYPIAGNVRVRQANGGGKVVNIDRAAVSGIEASGTIAIGGRNQLSGQLSAKTSDVAAQPYVELPLKGAATLNLTLSGTVNQPQAQFALAAPALSADTLTGIAVKSEGRANRQRVELDSAVVQWGGQSLSARGAVGLGGDAATLDLHAEVVNARIDDVLKVLGKADVPVSGVMNLEADLQGTVGKPEGEARLSVDSAAAYGEQLGRVSATARFDKNGATVPDLIIEKNAQERVTGQATYGFDTRQFTASLLSDGFQLAQGRVGSLDVQAQGTVDQPVVRAQVKGEVIDVGPVSLNATLNGKALEVKAAAARQNLIVLAQTTTLAPYPFTLSAEAQGTNLESIRKWVPADFKGTVSALLKANGEAENWQKANATLQASAAALEIQGQALKLESPLEATVQAGQLTLKPVTVSGPGTRLTAEGSVPGVLRVDGAVDVQTAQKAFRAAIEPEEKASGQLTLVGAIGSTLDNGKYTIDPKIEFELKDGFYASPKVSPLSGANIKARLAEGSLRIETLAAKWANATIAGKGELPLGLVPGELPFEFAKKGGPASAEFSVKGLDFAQIQGAPESVAGRTSFTAKVEASKPELEALRGEIRFEELNLNAGNYRLAQEGESLLRVDAGKVMVDRFTLLGPASSKLLVSGNVELTGRQALALRLDSNADLGLLAAFTETVRAQGATTIALTLGGTVAAPEAAGSIEVANGFIGMANPKVQAERLNVRIDLAKNQVRLSSLTGGLNGGTVEGSGGFSLRGTEVENLNLNLAMNGVYLDVPANFKTLSNATLTVRSVGSRILLGGDVNIIDGSYTDAVNLDQGLLNALNSGSSSSDVAEERSPLLERLDYGIKIQTENPLLVDNNLAKAEITLDARLTGSYYRPGLLGRVNIEEGGSLNLNERTYLVDRGVLTFNDDNTIEPSFDIVARTQASGYDVTLSVQGEGKDRQTTLTSDPPLPEPDIAAVLLTGRTLDEIQGQELDVAKEQVLSYLTGRVGGSLGRGIEQATGLSQVRIEPNLIANESDPSARLTVGQNFTRQLSLIYSMNLTDSGDQILVGQYDISKRFRTRALKQSDNSYRFDFSKRQEFGGRPPEPTTTAERERKRIGQVDLTGQQIFTEQQLRKWLAARQGKTYDFFKVRKGVERVSRHHADEGHLEARVRLNRTTREGVVDLELSVEAGPKVDFVYEGFSVSGGVQKSIREQWRDGVFDAQRADEAVEKLKEELARQGYLKSQIDYSIQLPEPNRKRVVFDIQTGEKYSEPKLVFAGAKGIEESELRKLLRDQKLVFAALSRPAPAIDWITRTYRERGFLDVKVAKPELILDSVSRSAQIVYPISEGAQYRVGAIDFAGNQAYPSQQLLPVLTLEKLEDYGAELREESLANLRALYARKGYNDAEVTHSLNRHPETGLVDVTFQIAEGPQSIVGEVKVEGNLDTSPNLVRSQLELKTGDPLDPALLSRSRRNLYTTGAYSLIDIQRHPLDVAGGKKIVPLDVNVREVRPFQFNYGGYFDTDRGPGGIVDFSNRNSLGSARTLGLRMRYDADLQEARVFFTQPLLKKFPLRTTGSSFLRREVRDGFNTDRFGFSVLQESRFGKAWILNYGYRWEQTRTYDRGPDPIFDATLRVAPFTAALSRDTRDDLLDATRGSLLSHAIEYAPTFSGSELNFAKYFGQYFRYFAFDKPELLPMQKGVRKSRLVLATGVRVGLAGGLNGQDLISGRSESNRVSLGERFFAGGGTTIRGFAQDGVGPRLFDRISPTGGNALFILNTEMRFPVKGIFDAVSFVDVGNVYDRIGDFRPWQVRKAAGLGIRIRTPYFLLRLDYGIKLDRKPGEPLGRPFFSIGQAF